MAVTPHILSDIFIITMINYIFFHLFIWKFVLIVFLYWYLLYGLRCELLYDCFNFLVQSNSICLLTFLDKFVDFFQYRNNIFTIIWCYKSPFSDGIIYIFRYQQYIQLFISSVFSSTTILLIPYYNTILLNGVFFF